MTDEEALAWLAGLLEGEGSFMITKCHCKNGKTYRYPRIGVTMTDRDVIARAALMFGTGVYDIKPSGPNSYLPQFRTGIGGQKAYEWMLKLYSFMGARRKSQMDKAINEWKVRPSANTMRSITMQAVWARKRRRRKASFRRAYTEELVDV